MSLTDMVEKACKCVELKSGDLLIFFSVVADINMLNTERTHQRRSEYRCSLKATEELLFVFLEPILRKGDYKYESNSN